MPQLLSTPGLVNLLMNLSNEENVKIFVFCVWQASDQMLMIKIEVHRRHFWIS